MRIAISGSHQVGKTTLAESLANALPGYVLVPEPYYLLLEEGNDFAEMPTVEDFELQLERSIRCIRESGSDVIFDRCPLDMIGHLTSHRDMEMFHIGDWLPDVREAVATLDLIAFIPVEVPDRIDVPPSERQFRADVDEALWDIIADDIYGLGMDVISVAGAPADRLRRILTHVT